MFHYFLIYPMFSKGLTISTHIYITDEINFSHVLVLTVYFLLGDISL